MQRESQIIEKYITADEETRLSMFLDHRELRRQFVKLDLAAAKQAGYAKANPTKEPSFRPAATALHNHCRGWLRRCWSLR